MEKNIWTMKLHETLAFGYWTVLRVPGGWLYQAWNEVVDQPGENPVFVPYSEDLKPPDEPTETIVDLGDID